MKHIKNKYIVIFSIILVVFLISVEIWASVYKKGAEYIRSERVKQDSVQADLTMGHKLPIDKVETELDLENDCSMYGSDDVGCIILPDNFTDSSEDIAPIDGSEGVAFKDKDNNEIYMIKYSQESSKDNTLKIMAESMTSGVCGNGTEVKVNTSRNGILRNSYVGETTLEDGRLVKVYTFCGNDDIYRSVIFLCDDQAEFEKYYNSYSLNIGIKELEE